DFMRQYNERQQRPAEKTPWKVYADRMREALQNLKTDTEGSTDQGKYVDKFVGFADPLLRAVAEGRVPDPTSLAACLSANPPTKPALYEGMPDAVVRGTKEPGE